MRRCERYDSDKSKENFYGFGPSFATKTASVHFGIRGSLLVTMDGFIDTYNLKHSWSLSTAQKVLYSERKVLQMIKKSNGYLKN